MAMKQIAVLALVLAVFVLTLSQPFLAAAQNTTTSAPHATTHDPHATTHDPHAADPHAAASHSTVEVCPVNISEDHGLLISLFGTADLEFGDEHYIEAVEEAAHLATFNFNFEEVKGPFLILFILLVITFLRVTFKSTKLGNILPDSCMVILVGVIVGLWIRFVENSDRPFSFSAHGFFLFILPPIIFEAGYVQCNNRVFMDNLGTILVNAIVGTALNTFGVGFTIVYVARSLGIDMLPIEGLVFGSIVAAVDPVAVLAVFEEVHVNETLHTIVFGESILNDGVAVVLYRICVALAYQVSLSGEPLDVGKSFAQGIASFVVVFTGGTLMGVVYSILAAAITRWFIPDKAKVVEPLLILLIGGLAYMSAEVFHFSGIVSIMVCGMLTNHYASKNIHKTSRISLYYFLKLTANTAETLVFLLLGVVLVLSTSQGWNTGFVFSAYFLTLLFRASIVVLFSYFLNKVRHSQITLKDQVVVSYGGLRGAIAFALSYILAESEVVCREGFEDDPENIILPFRHRSLFVTSTIMIVMFTVFIQGTTIKPLLDWLRIKRSQEGEAEGFLSLNDKLVDQTMAVMQTISELHTSSILRDFYVGVDGLLRKYLVKPGASYRRLLEVAEDKHMVGLLENIRREEAEKRMEQENEHLQEYERENFLWLQTHDTFKTVVKEVDDFAIKARKDANHQKDPGVQMINLLGKANLNDDSSKSSKPSTPEGKAKTTERDTAFVTRHAQDFAETKLRLRKRLKDKHARKTGNGSSSSSSSSSSSDEDDDGKASGHTSSSDGSEEMDLLSEGEIEELRRVHSDTALASQSKHSDFVSGKTWIPLPPQNAANGTGNNQPSKGDAGDRSYHHRRRDGDEDRAMLLDGMESLEELTF